MSDVPKRRLGATDIKTVPLAFGGNVFGWTADKATSFRLLDAFVDGGGTLIDTADIYSAWVPGHSGGESETILGEWLASSGKRDRVTIATKVGMRPGGQPATLAPDHIAAACEASLHRLQTDHIDLYYAHHDDPEVPQEAVLTAFGKLVEVGKVGVLGASNFKAARLKSANDHARAAGLPHYQVLQPLYNLASREAFEGELQDYAVEYNIGVLPYYGLAAGFLTGKYRAADDLKGKARSGSVAALLDGNGPKVLSAMDAIAAETGASLPQIALAWLAAQPGVTTPIASATSVEQLEELMGSLTLTLAPEQMERLDAAGT